MDIAAIMSVILGGLITIAVAGSIEFMRRPRLDLSIAPPVDNQYPDARPARSARFLRLRVTNHALPRCLRFISRLTASQCTASISFHRFDGHRVRANTMAGRWAGLPEPVPAHIQIGDQVGVVFDPARALVGQRIDVPAGESELLDVVAKFDDEPCFYGWSNANYFCDPMWRPNEWRFEPE